MSVVDGAPVGLRVAKDGTAQRVPLVVDRYGSPVGMLCEQIGCQVVQLVRLAGGLDLWLDEEALVFLDLNDRAAVTAAVNPVATMITSRTARLRQPIPVSQPSESVESSKIFLDHLHSVASGVRTNVCQMAQII